MAVSRRFTVPSSLSLPFSNERYENLMGEYFSHPGYLKVYLSKGLVAVAAAASSRRIRKSLDPGIISLGNKGQLTNRCCRREGEKAKAREDESRRPHSMCCICLLCGDCLILLIEDLGFSIFVLEYIVAAR